MNKYILTTIALWSFLGNLRAGTPEQEQAIKAFEFQGMKFGTDVNVFRLKFPSAQFMADESDPENGLHVFRIASVSGVDVVRLDFYDKALFQVGFTYFPETVNKFGGWTTVAEKIVAKFGKADADSLGTNVKGEDNIASFIWRFPDVERAIELRAVTKGLMVEFTDLVGHKKCLDRKKQKANVGF